MAEIGCTMMCEQRRPQDLIGDLVLAERAGFDFSVISDYVHPWHEEQGHSGVRLVGPRGRGELSGAQKLLSRAASPFSPRRLAAPIRSFRASPSPP